MRFQYAIQRGRCNSRPMVKLFWMLLCLRVFLALSSGSILANNVVLLNDSVVEQKALTFAVGKAAKFSTAINGRSHQQSPLVSYKGFQYATFYDARRRVCISRRKLPDGQWNTIHFEDHRIASNDAHNTAVIGICHKDGTIHMAFDHHATPLNYRVSHLGAAHDPDSTQWNVDLFGPVKHALGSIAPAERVTYPRFFAAPNGNLMLYYRGGTSGNGDGMIEKYDGETHDWSEGLGKFIARDIGEFQARGQTSLYRCPYMNDLCYAGGRLHASWVWRDRFKKTQARNQHDLCYAYSDDDGQTWQNSSGKTIGKTGVTAIHLGSIGVVVQRIPVDSGLTNQNTQFAYPDGSVHIIFAQQSNAQKNAQKNARSNARSRVQSERPYQHYWRDAKGNWSHQSLQLYGQRPKLVGAKDRSLFLVYSDEEEKLQIAAAKPNADKTAWQWRELEISGRPSVSGEPLLDTARWQTENVLSIYLQQEPRKIVRTNLSGPVDGFPSPLHVLDFGFGTSSLPP